MYLLEARIEDWIQGVRGFCKVRWFVLDLVVGGLHSAELAELISVLPSGPCSAAIPGKLFFPAFCVFIFF